jgi:hypothetical protein
MKNPEVLKNPEFDSSEILSFLDSLEVNHCQKFSFGGTNFNLIIISPGDPNDPSYSESNLNDPEYPFYTQSTLIKGFDIYIPPNLSPEKTKHVLFHEILECNLRNQGFSRDNAHEITVKEGRKFFDNDLNFL